MDKSQHSFVSQGCETRHYVYNWIIKTLHKRSGLFGSLDFLLYLCKFLKKIYT